MAGGDEAKGNSGGDMIDSVQRQLAGYVVNEVEFERQFALIQRQLTEQGKRSVEVQADLGESAVVRSLREKVRLQEELIRMLQEKNRFLVERITQLESEREELVNEVERCQSRLGVETVEVEAQVPEDGVGEDRLTDLLGRIEGLAGRRVSRTGCESQSRVREVAAPVVVNQASNLVNSLQAVSLIAPFAGKSHENVESFLQNICDVGRLCQWPDGFLVNVVKLKLAGDARTFVESVSSLRDASHFEVLAQGLRQRFMDKRGASYYRDQLFTMRQKSGEGYDAYADRIRAVSCKTYKLTGDAVRDEVLLEEAEARAVDVFVRGIDPQIGGEVKVSFPRTLHEAVRLAMLREEAKRFVAAPTRNREQKQVFTQEVKCGRCKRNGHRADECLAPYCPHCRSMGHLGMHCPKNLDRRMGSRGKGQRRWGNDQGAGAATPPGPQSKR